MEVRDFIHSRLYFSRALALLLSFAFFSLAIFLQPINAAATPTGEGQDETSRAIAVAYDNSTSMIENTDRWCSAHYSLEVLAGMLSANDEISVYAMDTRGEKLHLTGKEDNAQRVQKVHSADLGVSNETDSAAAVEALNWLSGKEADEKYLVITTDGEFTRNSAGQINLDSAVNEVRQTINKAADQGITVVYLAIGDQAETMAADPSRGIYVKKAADAEILNTMTDTANLIFDRSSLDSSSVLSTNKITLDVPMSQLIVFAQGENAKVGDLVTKDGQKITPKVAKVSYRDTPSQTGSWSGEAKVNKKLQGVVASFDSQIPKGEVELDISGSSNVEIYYKVNVDIAVHLTDDDGYKMTLAPNNDNKLAAGDYKVSYTFLDPDTGKELKSSLLENADFALNVDDGTEVKKVSAGERLSLKEGKAVFVASVQTPDGVRIRQPYNDVSVLPPPAPLNIKLVSTPGNPIDINNLDTSEPLVIEVTKEDGTPLSEQEWKATTLKVTTPDATTPSGFFGWLVGSEKGLDIEKATFGKKVGTFDVKLKPYKGDVYKTLDGDVKLDILAYFDAGVGASKGSKQETIAIDGLSWWQKALHWIFTHIVQLILMILFLLLLIVLFMLIRKPRMPKNLRPKISGINSGDEESLVIRKVKYSFWPPWKPEEQDIRIQVIGDSGDSNFQLKRRFQLGGQTITLVAVRSKHGRRFKFSEATVRLMENHSERAGAKGLPDPSYSNVKRTFSKGSPFSIMGITNGRRGWDRPENKNYEIRF